MPCIITYFIMCLTMKGSEHFELMQVFETDQVFTFYRNDSNKTLLLIKLSVQSISLLSLVLVVNNLESLRSHYAYML